MKHASLDNTDLENKPLEISASSESVDNGCAAAKAGDNSTREIARLKAECERLTALVRDVEKERDAYQRAATFYIAQQITREDVELATTMEEGLPFEVMLQEMERIDNVHETEPLVFVIAMGALARNGLD